jgi:hypothetical protein
VEVIDDELQVRDHLRLLSVEKNDRNHRNEKNIDIAGIRHRVLPIHHDVIMGRI